MYKFTHEEYTEWCLERGLHPPALCEKCKGSYHYVCFECNPNFFSRERLTPEDASNSVCDSPSSEHK